MSIPTLKKMGHRKEGHMRKDCAQQEIERDLSSQLAASVIQAIASAIRNIERKIEIAKDSGPTFEREIGYLAGLKFATALIELQAIQNERVLETPVLRIESDGERHR